jgi:hypothetical protein
MPLAGLTTTSALQTVTTAAEGWDTSATQAVRVTFTNANQMRWFFNAGGKVRITVGTTAASASAKDTAFANLGTAVGNLDIGSKSTTRSGTGETLTTDGLALGFHDLTTSYQTILLLTSDNTGYTSNTVKIEARLDAAVGTATYIEVQMTATDPSADDQYTAGNTAGVAAAIKDTPKMVTTLFTINPNTGEGLATAYTPSGTTVQLNTTA